MKLNTEEEQNEILLEERRNAMALRLPIFIFELIQRDSVQSLEELMHNKFGWLSYQENNLINHCLLIPLFPLSPGLTF